MGLQISIREASGVSVLDIQGRITIGLSADILGNQLRDLMEAGTRKLLLNFAGVPQVDSSGISVLVRSFVTLQRLGGSLKILHATGRVHQVLELTRILQTIPAFDDEAKALASFT